MRGEKGESMVVRVALDSCGRNMRIHAHNWVYQETEKMVMAALRQLSPFSFFTRTESPVHRMVASTLPYFSHKEVSKIHKPHDHIQHSNAPILFYLFVVVVVVAAVLVLMIKYLARRNSREEEAVWAHTLRYLFPIMEEKS